MHWSLQLLPTQWLIVVDTRDAVVSEKSTFCQFADQDNAMHMISFHRPSPPWSKCLSVCRVFTVWAEARPADRSLNWGACSEQRRGQFCITSLTKVYLQTIIRFEVILTLAASRNNQQSVYSLGRGKARPAETDFWIGESAESRGGASFASLIFYVLCPKVYLQTIEVIFTMVAFRSY